MPSPIYSSSPTKHRGSLANISEKTVITRLLGYALISMTEKTCVRFVSVGKAANRPIRKLEAPDIMASPTKKAPLVRHTTTSEPSPSTMIIRSPRSTSSRCKCSLGFNIFHLSTFSVERRTEKVDCQPTTIKYLYRCPKVGLTPVFIGHLEKIRTT